MATESINACLSLGRAWLDDLSLLVGNDVWCSMDEATQLERAHLRAELLNSHEHADKLSLLSPSGKAFAKDPAGLYTPAVQSHIIQTAVLNVYESTSEHRRAEAAAVGAALKLGFDFTKQSGENVGEEWLLTVKNENGQTVGKCAGPTTNYEGYEEFIREIGARANVTALLICLDDLLENAVGQYDARSQRVMSWIPSSQECILDRFHVVKRVNEAFNNKSAFFYPLMVVEQRDIVASRDAQLEKHIDGRLRAGNLHVECTWRKRKVVWPPSGKPAMTQEEIEGHKKSGLYHAMLSSTGAPRRCAAMLFPLPGVTVPVIKFAVGGVEYWG